MPKLEEVDHYLQWTNAIRGEGKTTSNFDYAGPLTETVLLGTIAMPLSRRATGVGLGQSAVHERSQGQRLREAAVSQGLGS